MKIENEVSHSKAIHYLKEVQLYSKQISKNKKLYKTIVVVFFSFFLISCINEKDIEYSFFVAGHVYGSPRGGSLGVYDSLKNKFDLINTTENMKFGVFTGDIVRSANKESWDSIDKDLNLLKVPVHFSRGNHDGELEVFEKRYGDSYKFFHEEGDLHLILDSSIESWNITGNQLNFLKQTLNEQSSSVNNIFIYVHHIIWWDKKGSLRPNSRAGISDKLTFWTDIAPFLFEINKPIFIFSGDVGAGATNPTYSYNVHKNLTLVTSGMGGGLKDNFIITNILNDGSVSFKLIALNGDNINELGLLENY